MWYEIFKFEINYRLNRWDTYLFFVFLFIFSLFGVEFVFQGIDLGLVKKNSPIVIAKSMAAVTGLSMLFTSMVMGVPILRDFQYNMASLMYVNPIAKKDYLWGRFLGSLVILFFIFSAVLLGMILGEFMPWTNANDYMPFQFINYLQPFLWVAVPIVLFGASLFFITGALTKKLMVVYTQGILVFVLFLLTKAITNEQLQALLDPFSLTTLSLGTAHWDIAEKNALLIPFTGEMLYHNLFWVLLGLAVLALGYAKFRLDTTPNGKAKKKPTKLKKGKKAVRSKIHQPFDIHPEFNLKSQFVQLVSGTWFHAKFIYMELSFWAIVLCSFIIIVINSVNLGTTYGVDSLPKTYLIIGELQEMSIYFFALILLFYSGELIWKEKELKIDAIYHATPVKHIIDLSSKFLALALIYITLILALIVGGVVFQTLSGYYSYEFDLYFYGFFVEILPFLLLYTLASFFIHIVAGKKFKGILMTLVFFVATVAIGVFGIEHVLVNYGGNALAIFSDMNGYGHFLLPYLLVKFYWFCFASLLFLFSSLLIQRGEEKSLLRRLRQLRLKRSGKTLKVTAGITLTLFLITGAIIFYNTNVLNEFFTKEEKQAFRAAYETTLKSFEYLPQPKITGVKLNLELYPSQRSYEAKGHYILKNTNDSPIQEIHIQNHPDNALTLSEVTFNQEATHNEEYLEFGYHIYTLAKPLLKGDSLKMDFKQTLRPSGFNSNDGDLTVIHNGTFFKNSMLPTLGYNRDYELTAADTREAYKLPERRLKADRDNAKELVNARTGSDSDGLVLDMTIGTEAGQTAITSGDLLAQWTENGRNYFRYHTKQPIINFYPLVSAKYQTLREEHRPAGNSGNKVDLEIYYHQGHEYNLNRMMQGMKASLDYYSANFSPYQYNQLRIVEFPRYGKFAQSFPSTIPFSESLGFILDIKEDDVDMVFYMTAHEVAHQWWGLQLEAANVKGRNMILETLSQYAAMMVLKEVYGEAQLQKFLANQREDYLDGKRRMTKNEVPLELVENEAHLYYAKGALNMYALQKAIGEEKVNRALRRFLNDWHTFNNPDKPGRYATTKDLLGYFRQETPDSLHYVIADLFEKVTPLDNKGQNR